MPPAKALVRLPLNSSVRKVRHYLRRLKTAALDWWRGETEDTFFDLRDAPRVNAILEANGFPPANATGESAGTGSGVLRVFEMRSDLRAEFPLGLTPKQRGWYLDWLLSEHGRRDFGLTPGAVLAEFRELDEDPSRGLTATYRWQPEWQAAVPHGLTRFGWEELKGWVSSRYGFSARWLRTATLPPQFGPWDELRILLASKPDLATSFPHEASLESVTRWAKSVPEVRSVVNTDWFEALADEFAAGVPDQPGVNVLSHFRFPSGLQAEASYIADGLRGCGFRIAGRDIPVASLTSDWSDSRPYHAPELFPVSFVKIGASEPFDDTHPRAGLFPRPAVYRIAGWSWELEQFPREYAERASRADEIWVPSEFCATAVRSVVADRPVLVMQPGVPMPSERPLPRREIGVPDEAFLVLFLFDMASSIERKNPLGLIRAFRRAFRPDESAHLVIKVSRSESRPADMRTLREAAAGGRVTLIDRLMPRAEVMGLMAACDCYASLHRAEGFGLTVAEAMLLGKPVVATDYSGTAEFLTPETGLPVGYRMIPVEGEYQPHVRDARWAEPDSDAAARHLRWVYEHRAEARVLGERARRHAETILSPSKAARRMAERLREILAAPKGRP